MDEKIFIELAKSTQYEIAACMLIEELGMTSDKWYESKIKGRGGTNDPVTNNIYNALRDWEFGKVRSMIETMKRVRAIAKYYS